MNTDRLMKHFFLRLNPPRQTFVADMTEAERAIMKSHGAYWRGLMEKGVALLFGPVLDPAGAWGLGIVRAADEGEARAFGADDPAVKSGLQKLEIYEIQAVVRG